MSLPPITFPPPPIPLCSQVPFESILDTAAFSVRVLQKDIPQLIDILQAIPEEEEESKRQAVHRVWHR